MYVRQMSICKANESNNKAQSPGRHVDGYEKERKAERKESRTICLQLEAEVRGVRFPPLLGETQHVSLCKVGRARV